MQPTTPLATRLQLLAGGPNISKAMEMFGMKRDATRKYLTGALAPSADVIEHILEWTGCSADWLITGHGEPFAREAVVSSQGIGIPPAREFAGLPGVWISDKAILLPTHIEALEVTDNSLAPVAVQGQTLLLSPDVNLADRSLVLAEFEGALTIRRVSVVDDTPLLLPMLPKDQAGYAAAEDARFRNVRSLIGILLPARQA